MSETCKCGRHCDNPRNCNRRWVRAGRPSGSLPPPSKGGRPKGWTNDDYELRWAEGEPERRIERVKHQAAALVRCVAASDGGGIGRLLERVTDHEALLIVLAECADPARVAIVTGTPGPVLAAVRPARPSEGDCRAEPGRTLSVDLSEAVNAA